MDTTQNTTTMKSPSSLIFSSLFSLPSEGLEPLASYWMRAPEPCTIHFLVIAETP